MPTYVNPLPCFDVSHREDLKNEWPKQERKAEGELERKMIRLPHLATCLDMPSHMPWPHLDPRIIYTDVDKEST